MKIGLLAPKGSGKSCYVVGLFGTLGEINADIDSKLQYEWLDPEQRGRMDNAYGRLIDNELEALERLPRPTGDITSYKFEVRYRAQDTNVAALELLDSPGGLLCGDVQGSGSGGTKDAVNSVELDEALVNCDAFIVLLDCTKFDKPGTSSARGKPSLRSSYQLATDHIRRILTKAVRRAQNEEFAIQSIPIALCLTKIDKCQPSKQIFDQLKSHFRSLFHESCRSPIMTTGLTLGPNIDEGGVFDPNRLELPLEFCFGLSAINQAKTMLLSADKLEGEVGELMHQEARLREELREINYMSATELGKLMWEELTLWPGANRRKTIDDFGYQRQQRNNKILAAQARASDLHALGMAAIEPLHDALKQKQCALYVGGREGIFNHAKGVGLGGQAIQGKGTQK